MLGNGSFFSQALGFTSGLKLICAALAISAVVLVPRIAWGEASRAWVARRRRVESVGCSGDSVYGHVMSGDDQDVDDARESDAASEGDAARIAWCVFWGLSAVLLSAAFVVSSTPVDINSDRYLVGVIYAAAALVPIAAQSPRDAMQPRPGTAVTIAIG